ncbi:MAG TPA: ABC transporter ATP-binding protein [Mariprofundaceae bacterium]|nr:ABC transporter ATP-binding protein [Mariprofundaceae bacterium]
MSTTEETPHAHIVRMQAVSKLYMQGKITVTALDRVTLEVDEGDFAALCGPSGSGKSTLLNLVGGLDEPSEGRIWLENRDLAEYSRSQVARVRRDRIGFVFQAYNLVPVMTAYENAEFVLRLQSVPDAERHERVMAVLQEVGLDGLEHRRPDEMSGGQQQRVAIARAIVTRPAIVLADEPTANVDSVTADAILDLMQKLNREEGITFLFSTHDQRLMARTHRLIYMRDGRIERDDIRR